MYMKSCFIKEQKRYRLEDLEGLLDIEGSDLTEILKRLRQYGILKIVENNKEELDRTDLLEDDDLITQIEEASESLYVFNFVGVFIVSNIVFKCYPKYINGDNYQEHLKKVISVLEKYNTEKQIVPFLNDIEAESNYNLLLTIIYLIKDYIEHGPYQKQEAILEVNGSGDINWDKTINETFTLLKNNRPFYPELITKRNQFDKYDYFKRLHQTIVTQSSKMMGNAGLLDLFSINRVEDSEESISDFGDLDYILYELEKELSIQFNTRQQFLLKLMYAFLSENGSFEKSDSIHIFGTSNFKKVWEAICQTTLDNDLKKPLIELTLPKELRSSYRPDETLLSIIEKPKWNIENILANSTRFVYPQGTFIPDCIKIKDKYFNIYDAKYYVPKIKDKTITGQPGIEDVSKQFLYQLVYKEFMKDHGLEKVNNYFLIPTEVKYEDRIYISMALFNDIGLNNIEVKFILADNIYDAYLSGKTDFSFQEDEKEKSFIDQAQLNIYDITYDIREEVALDNLTENKNLTIESLNKLLNDKIDFSSKERSTETQEYFKELNSIIKEHKNTLIENPEDIFEILGISADNPDGYKVTKTNEELIKWVKELLNPEKDN